MNFHRGAPIQQGAGLGSIFSGLFRTLMPVAKTAVKTVGKIAKSDGVRSAGRYLKKEATRAAIDTALEALNGKQVGVAAKKRLKNATKNILQASRNRIETPSSKTPARKGTTKRKNVRLPTKNFKRRRVEEEPLFDDDEYGYY